jgi:hypothetical protein
MTRVRTKAIMVAITNAQITYKYYFKRRAARKKLFCTIFLGIVSKYLLTLYLLPAFTIKASIKGSSPIFFRQEAPSNQASPLALLLTRLLS